MIDEKGKLLKPGEILIMVSKQGGYKYIAIVKVIQNSPQGAQPHCSVEILEILQVEKPLVIIEGTSLYAFYKDLFPPEECPQEVRQLLDALEKTCYIGKHRLPTPFDEVLKGNIV